MYQFLFSKEPLTDFQKALDYAAYPEYWVYDSLGIELHENQVEIINAVYDTRIKNLSILQARGGGKTYAVGLGLLKRCLDTPGLKVGIFGPKEAQANRIIEEIELIVKQQDSPVHKKINWKETTKSRLTFNNGSMMIAMSGAQTTQQEGWHFHIVVLDECHRIEDIVVSQRIKPMLGSYPIAKTIKIGIPAAKNNFWKSCVQDKSYLVLVRDWTECHILHQSGVIEYNGKRYPEDIVRGLHLPVKQRLFPDRPDLHYEGSDYSEIDLKTQFSMEWVADLYLELSEEDQKALVDSDHSILELGNPKDIYYFGLDTASGSLRPGKTEHDYTALSIWRKRSDGVKEKIACYEWYDEDSPTQIEEIRQIINPIDGRFKCVFGYVDHSNIGIHLVQEFKRKKIPVEGILFHEKEESSGNNFKNAMFNHFKIERESGRVKFPSLAALNSHVVHKKAFNEWCNIERHRKGGINDQIEAPSDLHDDHCCADVLAVWAADKGQARGIMSNSPGCNITKGLIIRHGREPRYLKNGTIIS